MSTKMPSVAWARMMKEGAEGREVIVGSEDGISSSLEVGEAGVEQDANKTANKHRLVLSDTCTPFGRCQGAEMSPRAWKETAHLIQVSG